MSDTEQREGEASADWKRDPIWHWRNWILALVGIIITVAIFLYEDSHKPVKALTCDLVAVGPLVSVEDDVSKRVQVVFDGKPVANAKFALIKVANAGNVPIEESDFKRPLTLHFGGSGTNIILTAQLFNSHPSNIGATYKANGDTLTLDPLLLNPDDNITLKVIYTGEGTGIIPDARILGVSEITGTDPKSRDKENLKQSVLFATVFALSSVSLTLFVGKILSRQRERMFANDRHFALRYLEQNNFRKSPISEEEIDDFQRPYIRRQKKR